MTVLKPPFQVHIVKLNNGIVRSNCRDAGGALLMVPHRVIIASAFDANKRSNDKGVIIDTDSIAFSTVTAVSAVIEAAPLIHLNCRADDVNISTTADALGNVLPGPYAILADMAFDASRNYVGGTMLVEASLVAPPPPPPPPVEAQTDPEERLRSLEDAVLTTSVILLEQAEGRLDAVIAQLEANIAART